MRLQERYTTAHSAGLSTSGAVCCLPPPSLRSRCWVAGLHKAANIHSTVRRCSTPHKVSRGLMNFQGQDLLRCRQRPLFRLLANYNHPQAGRAGGLVGQTQAAAAAGDHWVCPAASARPDSMPPDIHRHHSESFLLHCKPLLPSMALLATALT